MSVSAVPWRNIIGGASGRISVPGSLAGSWLRGPRYPYRTTAAATVVSACSKPGWNRGWFAVKAAEKAEAEVVRLRAALDDAACALMRAGEALAEFEGFEKSMDRAMRRAQDDCAAAFDAILPKKGHPMTTTNEAAMNGANEQ